MNTIFMSINRKQTLIFIITDQENKKLLHNEIWGIYKKSLFTRPLFFYPPPPSIPPQLQ